LFVLLFWWVTCDREETRLGVTEYVGRGVGWVEWKEEANHIRKKKSTNMVTS